MTSATKFEDLSYAGVHSINYPHPLLINKLITTLGEKSKK